MITSLYFSAINRDHSLISSHALIEVIYEYISFSSSSLVLMPSHIIGHKEGSQFIGHASVINYFLSVSLMIKLEEILKLYMLFVSNNFYQSPWWLNWRRY